MIKKQNLLNNLFGGVDQVSPSSRQKILIEKIKERIENKKFSNFQDHNIQNVFQLTNHKSLSDLNQSGMKKSSSQITYISPNQTLNQIMISMRDKNQQTRQIVNNVAQDYDQQILKQKQATSPKTKLLNQTLKEKNSLSKILSESMEKIKEKQEDSLHLQNSYKPSLKKEPKREAKRQRIVQQFFYVKDNKSREESNKRDSKSPATFGETKENSFRASKNQTTSKIGFYYPQSPGVKNLLAARERTSSKKKLDAMKKVDQEKLQNSLELMKKTVINRSLQQLVEYNNIFIEDKEKKIDLSQTVQNVSLNKYQLLKPSVNEEYDGQASRQINQNMNYISQSRGRLSRLSKDDIQAIQYQVSDNDLPQIASKTFKQQENVFKKRSFSEKKSANQKDTQKKPQYYNKWYIPIDCWGTKRPDSNNKSELIQNLSKNPDYLYQNIHSYQKDNPLTSEKLENNPRYIKLQLLQNQIMKNQMAKKLKKHLEEKQIRIPSFLKGVDALKQSNQ